MDHRWILIWGTVDDKKISLGREKHYECVNCKCHKREYFSDNHSFPEIYYCIDEYWQHWVINEISCKEASIWRFLE
jgi:hypothetical protein